MYRCRAFRVMIASPGDVFSERAIVREVLHEWNVVHSLKRKIVLLPVGWESHSSPEMGSPAQELINSEVLAKCDVLVGVFWTRLGTPTMEHESGTVEEIKRHMSEGKPTMIYFSKQPVVYDSVDEQQMSKLKAFKEFCTENGFFNSYDSQNDFKDMLYRGLQIKVNEHPIFADEGEENGSELHGIIQSETEFPGLSSTARVLLKEMSEDQHGTLLILRTLGGTAFQANSRTLLSGLDRREIAKWEKAVESLVQEGLVIQRNEHKYEVTDKGYRVSGMTTI